MNKHAIFCLFIFLELYRKNKNVKVMGIRDVFNSWIY